MEVSVLEPDDWPSCQLSNVKTKQDGQPKGLFAMLQVDGRNISVFNWTMAPCAIFSGRWTCLQVEDGRPN